MRHQFSRLVLLALDFFAADAVVRTVVLTVSSLRLFSVNDKYIAKDLATFFNG
jgi:hypothetical protein